MRRGTTPTLTFTIPYEADLIKSGLITFQQRGVNILNVPLSDESVAIEDFSVAITLTENQTLAMTAADSCRAQIRAVLESGKKVASNIVDIPICDILNDEVI